MKKFFLITLGAILIFCAAYFGGYWAFIGGIVTILEAIKAEPISGLMILWGIVMMTVLAGPIFWVGLYLGLKAINKAVL